MNVRITGRETRDAEITVDLQTAIRVVANALLAHYGFPPGTHINPSNGQLYRPDRGQVYRVRVNPTADQLSLVQTVDRLKQYGHEIRSFEIDKAKETK